MTTILLMDLTMEVNGTDHTIAVEPRTTLADALREDCHLTGAHVGCTEGSCGTCTVLIDGEPVRACTVFAVQAHGKAVRTVEGLADGTALSPVQQAFCDHHAVQCGYCTPGFIMLITAALEQCPDMDEAALRAVIASNLCRCTGYAAILAAAKAAQTALRTGRS